MAALREMLERPRKLVVGYGARLRHVVPGPLPADLDPGTAETVRRTRAYSMVPPARMAAVCDAAEYAVRHAVPGAFVECGVWRGGSMMAVALTLLRLGVADRDLYLFDTFSGMPEPTSEDTDSPYDAFALHQRWARRRSADGRNWHAVPVERVRGNMESTGYPSERIHLVEGRVEDTVPDRAPEEIAVLRLDTDWYASTRHELEHLWPRLASGGVLHLDDYGHYAGARRAVDEFLETSGERVLLHRVDYTGRTAVKQSRGPGV